MTGNETLIGESPVMAALRQRIGDYARADATTLVCGETGTGKELVARALHASSPRAMRAFVAVNASSLPSELVESELFGSVRGAYTGAFQTRGGLLEAAHGGTLFLDEVAELPACVQAKLLRVLEDGSYRPLGASRELKSDVHIVAATHRDLPAMCAKGDFRLDLLYRLDVLRIDVPPLRERLCDVPLLVRHFLEVHRAGSSSVEASPWALAQLLALPWPGNVRELRNAVRRTLARCPGSLIEAFDLGAPQFSRAAAPSEVAPKRPNTCEALRALADHGGRLAATARYLGVSPRTLQRRLRTSGLSARALRRTLGRQT